LRLRGLFPWRRIGFSKEKSLNITPHQKHILPKNLRYQLSYHKRRLVENQIRGNSVENPIYGAIRNYLVMTATAFRTA
jgi:hypothetical protein